MIEVDRRRAASCRSTGIRAPTWLPTRPASACRPPRRPRRSRPTIQRRVLGTPTRSGRWSIARALEPRSRSPSDSASDAVADRVVLHGDLDAGRYAGVALAGAGGHRRTTSRRWPATGRGAERRLRPIASRHVRSRRCASSPRRTTPPRPLGLQRVQVPAVGMGVAVRYRTGPTPDLAAAPWVAVEEEEGPLVVAAQRYVQIQCEMWSRFKAAARCCARCRSAACASISTGTTGGGNAAAHGAGNDAGPRFWGRGRLARCRRMVAARDVFRRSNRRTAAGCRYRLEQWRASRPRPQDVEIRSLAARGV